MTKNNTQQLTVYSTQWCGDCRRSKHLLDNLGIEYNDIDLGTSPEATALVLELNQGKRSVPTILFPDNTFLTEPRNEELENKLKELKLI